MKKLNLALLGFANYVLAVNTDGTGAKVTHTDAEGKETVIEPNEKGLVSMTASADIKDGEKVIAKAGKVVKYPVSLLLETKEGWTIDTAGATKELTPEQKAAKEKKDALKAEHKKLKDAVTTASANVGTAILKGEDMTAVALAYKTAKEALDKFELEHKPTATGAQELTPEQQELLDKCLNAKNDYNEAIDNLKGEFEAARAACETAGITKLPKLAKGAAAEGEAVPNRAPHLSFEIAEEIRKAYAAGRFGNEGTQVTVKELADKYNCTTSAINHIVNYCQWKPSLNATPAYVPSVPMVNEYYDAAHPLPYAENYKGEGIEKYMKADKKAEYLAKKAAATAEGTEGTAEGTEGEAEAE